MFKDISREYFLAFAKKDIQSLARIFDQGIILTDWDNQANGIEEVLLIYEKIFSHMKNFDMKIINVCAEESIVITELMLKIEGRDSLKIVDVIKFTELGKIKSISAYKG